MTLSCDQHTAFIYDRGGVRKIGEMTPLTRITWERRRDDVSMATVWVKAPDVDCRRTYALTRTNRHELVVFRGKQRVWEGPITHLNYEGGELKVEARDVSHYSSSTIMRAEYDNRYPDNCLVLDRIRRVMSAELARKEAQDPPINVLKYVGYLYAPDSETFAHRQYDTTPIVRAIGAARTMQDLTNALGPMKVAYGFSEGLGFRSDTEWMGTQWTNPVISNPKLKPSILSAIDSLAMYPPNYAQSLGMKGFYFVSNLIQPSRPTWDIGGVAGDGTQLIDVENHTGSNVIFGSAYITHHEFNHIQYMRHLDTIVGQFYDNWMAANPPGFTYNVNYQQPTFTGANPRGFVRDYARYSLMEDVAEVAAVVFTPSAQKHLANLLATDPYVKRKVELFKAWISERSGGLVSGQSYYEAIHSGTLTVAGPSGIRDAGTAAHTLPYEMTVFEHFDTYAARGGIDYTTVGRRMIFFDVHTKIGQTPIATEGDFIGPLSVTEYGMEQATEIAMTDGKGNYGIAGGDDPYYGQIEKLHQAYDEDAQEKKATDPENTSEVSAPPSVAEMKSQAERLLGQGRVAPVHVRLPDNTRLNPNGVLSISDLVPGVWIPLQARVPGRTFTQMQKLDSMSVEETSEGGETIKIVLSPAYSENVQVEES